MFPQPRCQDDLDYSIKSNSAKPKSLAYLRALIRLSIEGDRSQPIIYSLAILNETPDDIVELLRVFPVGKVPRLVKNVHLGTGFASRNKVEKRLPLI